MTEEYEDMKTAGTMQEEFERWQKQEERERKILLDEDGMMPDDDKVNDPSHYQSMINDINIDCITAMRAAFGDEEVAIFCKLNAFKYNWRASSKGKNIDIGKAVWYLNKFLELGGYD